jgi:tetratricopeptide (TPR) repeat protein
MMMKNVFLKTVIGATVIFVSALLYVNSLWAYSFPNWAQGASGYEEALSEAKDTESPLILYFNTEWCKWCKKMNSEYLSSWEIESFLSDIPKVNINPDNGSAEKALKRKYRVNGVPSFLISIPAFSNKTQKAYPFLKSGHLSVDEFLAQVKDRIARQYNQKALSSFKSKAHEDALGYLEMAISYDSENVYAYYLNGFIYHSRGIKEKDLELLEKAEENYQKALELDPDHKEARKELNKLTKLIERAE